MTVIYAELTSENITYLSELDIVEGSTKFFADNSTLRAGLS